MVSQNNLTGFAILLVALHTTSAASNKVQVDVYYESLCPDSKDIFKTMCTNWASIGSKVNMKLIPFGKADSTPDGFTCQHGQRECDANMFQSCALNMLQPGSTQMAFACCFMSNPANKSGCASKVGLDIATLNDCMNNGEGRQLQLVAERDTKKNTPGPKYVPTVVFNGKYKDEDENEIISGNFMGALNKYLNS